MMRDGAGATLPELLHNAGFVPDREGSGELWDFLNAENPKITFTKGNKAVEFEKRYRKDFFGDIIADFEPERHVKFTDNDQTTAIQSNLLFHTSKDVYPGDEFMQNFLGIEIPKWEDDEDDDETDTNTHDIPPAGRTIPEVIAAIGTEMVEQSGKQTIPNNKTSKNGEVKKRKYKKRKTKSATKAKGGKGGSKKQGQQISEAQSSETVRSNALEESRV